MNPLTSSDLRSCYWQALDQFYHNDAIQYRSRVLHLYAPGFMKEQRRQPNLEQYMLQAIIYMGLTHIRMRL
jgi:hypothetical protein